LVRIEREARFEAPIDEVFAYIADFRTLEEYNPSLGRVRYLDEGPPGQGSRFELMPSMLGVKFRTLLTITKFRENELIATRLDAFVPADETRVFRAEGGDTLLLFAIEFATGWPLVGPLADRLLARFFAEPQADNEIGHLVERFNARETLGSPSPRAGRM
jgi:uncharacterized membrane protein